MEISRDLAKEEKTRLHSPHCPNALVLQSLQWSWAPGLKQGNSAAEVPEQAKGASLETATEATLSSVFNE